ncbi:T9SS type A sorting domain-containing protein [candidate division WOR-3 bacterium]|uniref:T9SS type A sorting domain-containing protein n=1 Tax=candidate division WOR-3 bacterium TaxID=2052148 RepID=A0A9D5K9R9_UNCW3|nr:T9SS type A sorting domain-containing protein [candidate division WOR-3 bacterium]MBD3364958.1 T9SS type A sorting domain-containing protein [candidate division WOR-3 bacterium]
MKKMALILAGGVILLSATQWQEKLLTDDPQHYYVLPSMVLDDEGYVHILYLEMFEDWEVDTVAFWLKVSSNETGRWISKEITRLSESFYWNLDLEMQIPYSIDVDSKGNTYVAYFDFVGEEETRLFFATDSGGEFIVDTLIENDNWQVFPMLEIDNQDNVKLVYIEAVMVDEEPAEINLCYGRFDGGFFYTEDIWELGVDFEGYPMDMALGLSGFPNVFYTNEDYKLSRVYRGSSGWQSEGLTKTTEGYMPSACLGPGGDLYLTYITDVEVADIFFMREEGSVWQGELVADSVDFDWYLSSSLSFNPDGIPYLVWSSADEDWYYDIHMAARCDTGWVLEQVTTTPIADELFGTGHCFTIDSAGYGHMTYMCIGDYSETAQLMYAKTTEPLEPEEVIAENHIQPNPVGLSVRNGHVHFSLPGAGRVSIDAFDACGRRVKHVLSGFYDAGEHQSPLELSGIPNGVYFIRLQTEEHSARAKFVISR